MANTINTNRKFISIELDEEYFNIAKKRNLLYMHMLDKMAKDPQFRDAVIVGDVDNYLYSEEKGWVELRKKQLEANQ